MFLATQIFWLVIIAVVVASIAWTFTQEEIFKEWRDFCADRCEPERNILVRKFFYVWTCEYCFSHWVTILALILTGFKLLIDDWRGYVLAFFAIPWLANQLMSLYRLIRVDIKHENALAEKVADEVQSAADGNEP
ncbi:MAG: hypothetical protein ABI999_05430 [Acidobacteriota bacterium]